MTDDSALVRAQHYLDLRRPEQAEQVLRAHLAQEPNDADALVLLAFTLSGLEQEMEAIEVARRAVREAPGDPQPYLILAGSHASLGQTRQAIEAGREAVRLAPGQSSAHYALALALSTTKPATALASVEAGLQISPTNPSLWNLKAVCLSNAGRTDEARAALDEALRLDPNNSLFIGNGAMVDLAPHRLARAAGGLSSALRANPFSKDGRRGVAGLVFIIMLVLTMAGVVVGAIQVVLAVTDVPWWIRIVVQALLVGALIVFVRRAVAPLGPARWSIVRSTWRALPWWIRAYEIAFTALFLVFVVGGLFLPSEIATHVLAPPLVLCGPTVVAVPAIMAARRAGRRWRGRR